MVFSSLAFLCVFLPVVFGLYSLLANIPALRGTWAANGLLIIASLLFYAYGEPVYVLLMIASSVVNWGLGGAIAASRARQGDGSARGALVLAVIANLAVLGVFKYADMIVGTVNALTGAGIPLPQITLPIGISFFTFQAMSYVIDVYRGQVQAERNYLNVLLYISFFPQLIAGPIIKYHDVALQIRQRRQTVDGVACGLRRFCFGLAKKVLLANQFAVVADALFAAQVADLNIASAWLAGLAYFFQIYFDFSAYSDMAIGLGAMFGFSFKENFNYPYVSVSIKDFWRRWHISLSTWFREYLYFPLGGNRKGAARASLNRIIVFFCCGLWHGASWTFVLWGLYQGLFLLLEQFVPKLQKLPRAIGHVYALVVVIVGWVLFRADTLGQAGGIIACMFTGFDFDYASMQLLCSQFTGLFIVVLVVGVAACLPVKERLQAAISGTRYEAPLTAASFVLAIVLLLLCMLELSAGGYNPFIYFRF